MRNRIITLIKKNKESILYILMGILSFWIFFDYFFGNIQVDFSEIPAGVSGKRAYFVEMVLYKIGGYSLLKTFYLASGIIVVLVGVLNLKNEENQYFVFNKIKKIIKALFKSD